MELKDHNLACAKTIKALNAQLVVVMGDIAIMTMILEMSDCDAKLLMQHQPIRMLRCENTEQNCYYDIFDHADLQKEVQRLKAPSTQDRLAKTFAALYDDDSDDSDDSIEAFVQVDDEQ